LPGYIGLYRVGPLTHLKMCVFFSALNCLSRGSSPKFHKLRDFTAKGKSMSELHTFVSAVHCYCQHSKALSRLCATDFPTEFYKYIVHLLPYVTRKLPVMFPSILKLSLKLFISFNRQHIKGSGNQFRSDTSASLNSPP